MCESHATQCMNKSNFLWAGRDWVEKRSHLHVCTSCMNNYTTRLFLIIMVITYIFCTANNTYKTTHILMSTSSVEQRTHNSHFVSSPDKTQNLCTVKLYFLVCSLDRTQNLFALPWLCRQREVWHNTTEHTNVESSLLKTLGSVIWLHTCFILVQ